MPELTSYQKAALDYSKHISLTANAGSGKTFVLSKRYVEIALNENIPLSRMVAITFTEKAAGELYRKVAGEIESRLLEENEISKIKILERIRRQLVSANISTIHSFCINLLQSFPVESSVDAGFTPIDQIVSDELIDQSIEKYINDSINEPDKFVKIKYLIRRLGSKQNFTKQLKELIGKRKKMLKIVKDIYSQNTDKIVLFFNTVFEKSAGEILGELCDRFIQLAEIINNSVLENDNKNLFAPEAELIIAGYRKDNSITEKLKFITKMYEIIFTKAGTVKLTGYLKKTDAGKIEAEITGLTNIFYELKNFLIDEFSEDVNEPLADFGVILSEVYTDILSVYSEKKRHKSYLDFEDILIFAEHLLEKDEVKQELTKRFNFIMIDEYQDTDELQYNIFMPILDNLRKGNLFVVGDEKQSIYMFRDAEPEIFTKTRDEINCEGRNNILNLPHTFRLYPEIAHFTNCLFKQLFANPNPLLNEVEYSELICAREESEKGKVEILLGEEDSDETEAGMVALKILEELAGSVSPDFANFAVLCRKRDHFIELEKAFSQNNIPYQIVGGKGFYQRQPVYDILNLLEFLLDNKNDTALLGTLRSPFFNFSDSLIFKVFQDDGATLIEKIKKLSKSDKEINAAVRILERFIKFSHSLDLNILIRKILEETGYWSVAAAMPDGLQETANLKKLISVAGNFFNQGLKSLYDFIDFLKTSVDQLEDESQAKLIENDNTVKIMTIHQSKGLEFETVFLYRCNDKPRDDGIKSKSISISKQFGILTKVPRKDDYFKEYDSAPVVMLENYISRRKTLAEQKRLLYVAVTRAVKNLFICGTHKEFKLNKNSFLEFITSGLNIELEKDLFITSGGLQFLKVIDGSYKDIKIARELKINIIKTHSQSADIIGSEKSTFRPQTIFPISIKDYPKGDIISATKIAVYSQCPLKYHLAYDLGLKKLEDYYKSGIDDFDFSGREEIESSYADIKGTIIHSILEKEINSDQLERVVNEKIEKEMPLISSRKISVENLKTAIVTDLQKYYNSKIYSDLKAEKNYKNEFEVYTAEGENYLFGIIDKLIFGNNKITIVDYKTDNISADQITGRAANYENQLAFYGYIISRLYPGENEINYKLVFIKHPEIIAEKLLTKDDILQFKVKLSSIIKNIQSGMYPPDLQHCEKCYFAINHRDCIYKNN